MDTWINNLIVVALGGLIGWFVAWIERRRLLRKLKLVLFNRRDVCLNEEFFMTEVLSSAIRKKRFKPDIIYAVAPGGAMIAEWLSRRFLGDVENPIPTQLLWVKTVRAEGSGGKSSSAVVDENLNTIPPGIIPSCSILLVSDISRGGGALLAAIEFLKQQRPDATIFTATLFSHVATRVKPTFFVAETDKHVVFDWKEVTRP